MSATAVARDTLDISGTKPVPFGRLVGVETRKMYDTRAGFWLLVTIGLVTAAVITIVYFAVPDNDRTFMTFMGATATPQGFLIPVMAILLVTSEWSQRSGLVTFALEPSRVRVILAKASAAVLIGLGALVLAIVVAALAAVLAGAPDPWDGVGIDEFGKFALLQLSAVLQGIGFGLLFMASATAIVFFFALPMALSILNSFWSKMSDLAPWIDLSFSQAPLYGIDNRTGAEVSHLTGEMWAQLATSSALWILLPILVGTWRVLRAEIK